MDRNATLTTITTLAEQLCDPRHHVERIPYWDTNRNRKYREWRTTQPGLLAQLHEAAVEPADARNDPGPRSVPGSRPPLALEALSTHMAITAYAAHWCWSLKIDQRDTVEANIRALVGKAPTLDDDALTALASEMRRWTHWAAVASRWVAPPFEPHVPCPACQAVGKLRVNLRAQIAHCRGCQNTWAADDGSIFHLGEYIQAHANNRQAA
ncbi:DUF7341 domain-containing protein [Micromonospora sp. URMC 103]|uniref:DUF7341 domain-containing protein n=1 Tax=Micromonospora sp. URMC 103 TaxID=3423406 RepID=UPI003F1A6958